MKLENKQLLPVKDDMDVLRVFLFVCFLPPLSKNLNMATEAKRADSLWHIQLLTEVPLKDILCFQEYFAELHYARYWDISPALHSA